LSHAARRDGGGLGILARRPGHRPGRRARHRDHVRPDGVARRTPREPRCTPLRSRPGRRGRRMNVDEARALFPVLERVAYLNAGTFGPLARPTADVIAGQLRRDLEQGRSGKPYIDDVLAARAALRGLIAELLAAPPERVSLTSSTTDGCNI